MANKFMPIQPSSDLNSIINQINQNFAQLDAEVVTKKFNNSQGGDGLISGRLPNDLGTGTLLYGLDGKALISMRVDNAGTPSLKVAKSGFDANTATDAQLAFNSSQNTLKVVKTGNATLSAVIASAGDTVSVTIPHGLSFVPIPLVFMLQAGVGYKPLPTYTAFSVSGVNLGFNTWSDCVSDETNLYIRFSAGSAANWGNWSYKYYLLQETAN